MFGKNLWDSECQKNRTSAYILNCDATNKNVESFVLFRLFDVKYPLVLWVKLNLYLQWNCASAMDLIKFWSLIIVDELHRIQCW